MSQLFVARRTEQHVGEILREFDFADFESLTDLRKQAMSRWAFKSGLSVSANLFLDSWDTPVGMIWVRRIDVGLV